MVLCGTRLPSFATSEFEQEIQPLLHKYCVKCHGNEKTKGGVNLESVASQEAVEQDPKRLERMLPLVRDREMPPAIKTTSRGPPSNSGNEWWHGPSTRWSILTTRKFPWIRGARLFIG